MYVRTSRDFSCRRFEPLSQCQSGSAPVSPAIVAHLTLAQALARFNYDPQGEDRRAAGHTIASARGSIRGWRLSFSVESWLAPRRAGRMSRSRRRTVRLARSRSRLQPMSRIKRELATLAQFTHFSTPSPWTCSASSARTTLEACGAARGRKGKQVSPQRGHGARGLILSDAVLGRCPNKAPLRAGALAPGPTNRRPRLAAPTPLVQRKRGRAEPTASRSTATAPEQLVGPTGASEEGPCRLTAIILARRGRPRRVGPAPTLRHHPGAAIGARRSRRSRLRPASVSGMPGRPPTCRRSAVAGTSRSWT